MRIGIDCRTILNPSGGEKAGIGHYTSALVQQLLELKTAHKFVLFFDANTEDAGVFETDHSRVVYFPFSKQKAYLPYVYSHLLTAAAIGREKLDVFHGPANTLPLKYRGTSVVTVHDLAIYKHPEWFPEGQAFSVKKVVPESIRRAKKIIAVSQATKADIIGQFSTPRQKIRVVYEGADPISAVDPATIERLKNRFHLAKKYILFIGTIEPRKNLVRLVQAFDQLIASRPARDRNVSLVLAGAKGWKFEEVFSAIKQAKYSHLIRYIGYVTEEEKSALLSGACCFAFPSLYEGFGLPIVEAMQAGAPVLTSNLSATAEVAGDAAELVDPERVVSISEGLRRILFGRGIAAEHISAGLARARTFSWHKCAKETLAVYESL